MIHPTIEDQTFNGITFQKTNFVRGDYEGCQFLNCQFTQVDLSNFNFVDCHFADCDLSLMKFKNTALKTVTFKNCKLLGADFSVVNPFLLSLAFEKCVLNLASFYKLKLKATQFKTCSLKETDFTACDLSQALFKECDLLHATFYTTILAKANFQSAFNFMIDPEQNQIKNAKFSLEGLPGLLHKYEIDVTQ